MSFLAGLFGAGQNKFQADPSAINNDVNSYEHIIAGQDNTNQANLNNNFTNENNLVGQLTAQANGQGVNPAQNMLNQATNTNINNAASMAASTAGINPALAARMAVDAGNNANQTAAGQAATMNANQRLGALGQLSGVEGQIGNQGVGLSGINRGAETASYGIRSQNQNSANAINAGVSQQNANREANAAGGLGNAAGAVLGLFAEGGMIDPEGPRSHFAKHVKKYAEGGDVNAVHMFDDPNFKDPALASAKETAGYKSLGDSIFGRTPITASNNAVQGAQNMVNATPALEKPMFGQPSAPAPMSQAPSLGAMYGNPMAGPSLGSYKLAKGGKVPAMVSPGEIYLPPDKVDEISKSKNKGKKVIEEGEKIPGKAKVKGDSYDNDTVPKTLEAGGIVIPRHITESDNPSLEAAKFVDAVMAKKRAKGLRR